MEIHTDQEPLPDPAAEPVLAVDGYGCVVCGVELPYSGRGKRRKYCDEHKPARTTRSGTGRPTNVDTLIEQMATLHIAIGAGLGYVPSCQLDGMAVASNATALAESWRPLILRDPNVRKFWERVTTGSGWGSVIMAYGVLGMTIASNHNLSIPGTRRNAQPVDDIGGL